LTPDEKKWWPPMLWPLVEEHGPCLVRRIGEEVLGYPPDVFGIHFDDLRILAAALSTLQERN
jgi:hypothetical protein